MGEKNKTELDIIYLDGKKAEIEPLPEITHTEPLQAERTAPGLGEMAVEIPLKIPKNYRCGSRKRFVKLLMSIGVERNAAEVLAQWVGVKGNTYRKAWQNFFFWGPEKREYR